MEVSESNGFVDPLVIYKHIKPFILNKTKLKAIGDALRRLASSPSVKECLGIMLWDVKVKEGLIAIIDIHDSLNGLYNEEINNTVNATLKKSKLQYKRENVVIPSRERRLEAILEASRKAAQEKQGNQIEGLLDSSSYNEG